MPTKILALAAALTLAVSGAAFAQSSTGKGGTGGTTDSASPVRNNTGNSMRPTNGSPAGATTGSTGTMAPGNAPGGTMGGGAGSAGGGNSAAGR
ncbi:hypothetical protein ASF53_04845 [Methylobacterium sp. Leaf123]|uniref:hypothetical protein n=1 Tax=Methylobacterium sp. Leaf123 TaxID=1736264 RepID=UPI0006F2CABD|nr:hypothetical protein [Methylobacterium sp. Leaf123]KQQ23664.1 hypothetical protein ASF53_04845 [Methylobacterium sp. Leaf123]